MKKNVINSIAILIGSGTIPEWTVGIELTKKEGVDIKIQQCPYICCDVYSALYVGEVY